MAVCDSCQQEMTTSVGCTLRAYTGENNERIPASENCHDCYAPSGTMHHPGCDAERCTDCGTQAISCNCYSVS